MKVLYLCGAGNSEGVRLALRINQRQHRWERIVLLDDDEKRHGESILGVEIAGSFTLLADADPETAEVANLVARSTERRTAARDKIQGYGLSPATLIDPDVDTTGAEIGEDTIVYQNSIVGPEVSVDEASVVFMSAIVGHESHVARCCIVAPHAVLNARVELGEGAYVGSNATVLPEVRVGSWATIGAGSVAMQNVPAGATVMGVPAKVVMTLKGKLKMLGSDTPPKSASM